MSPCREENFRCLDRLTPKGLTRHVLEMGGGIRKGGMETTSVFHSSVKYVTYKTSSTKARLGLPQDEALKMYVRGVNLDAIWSRKSSTVAAHLWEVKRMEKGADEVGFPLYMDPVGPCPFKNVQGIRAAVAVLQRSLSPGLYGPTVQYKTVRKTRSTIAVCSTTPSRVCIRGGDMAIMAS
jgi:hypothetical protein